METCLRLLRALVGVTAMIFPAFHVWAQSYPAKPIRLVIPFAPGGTNELLGRIISQKLQERWGQPVLLENRPGAGGNIGAELVAKSAPDGYTLLFGTNTLTMNRFVFKSMPFDAQRDFAPVALVATTPFAIIVTNALSVRSVAELIAYAKANPGKLSYGTPGIGTPHHLGSELFQTMTGARMVHVPYKGSVPALTAVMTGELGLMWITVNVAMPFITAGKVRALAVAEPRRIAVLKDVPAIAETVPGYEVSAWYGVFAPAATPPEIVEQLSAELQRMFQSAELKDKLPPGLEVTTAGANELRALVANDLAKWGKVVADAGIKPE